MAIKHKIKFNATVKGYQARGTSPAELRSSGPKHSAERPATMPGVSGESAGRSVSADDMSVFDDKTVSDDYKTGGAYKAMLKLFADNLKNENNT